MRALTSAGALDELSHDQGIISLRPAAAFVAEDENEVLAVLGDARRRGLAVTPRGAGTSIPSQAVGTGVILLQRQSGRRKGEGSVTCGSSVVKADLNKELDAAGSWVPPDPSSYQSCTVGGMVANNSSGTRTLKYGSTIDFVRELRTILPEEGAKVIRPIPLAEALEGDSTTRKVASIVIEGQKLIQKEKPRVTKNSSGYRLERVVHDGVFDLPKLFVGSEGTLGIFTDVTFRTAPKPKSRVLLVVETSLPELDRVASLFRALSPSAVELVDKSVFREVGRETRLLALSRSEEDYLVYCELDGGEEDVKSTLESAAASDIAGLEPLTVTDPGRMAEVLDMRNEILTLAAEIRRGSRRFLPGVEDLTVPPERLGDLISLLKDQFERRGLSYISYGHAGDANLHMRPLLDPDSPSQRRTLEDIMDECFDAVWRMRGTMSGEHGDGMLRARYVRRQYPETHELMKQVREAYDPKGLLNPGVKIV